MNYIKILLFVLLAAAILAADCFASWDGAYVGLTAGYESGNAKISNADTTIAHAKWANNTNALLGDFCFKGGKLEAFVGYGKTINNHYVGFEVGSLIYQSQGKVKHYSYDGFYGSETKLAMKVLKNEAFTASFKVGYKLNEETLFYIKPGVSSTKFSLNILNTNNHDPDVHFNSVNIKRFNGLSLELGVEMRINDRFLLRMGGSHTFYRRKFFTSEETQCGRIRFSPQSTQVKTGIVMPLFL